MTIVEKIVKLKGKPELIEKFKLWCSSKKLDYEILIGLNSVEEIEKYLKSVTGFLDEDFARWCSDHNTEWNDSNFFVSKDVTTLSNCCFAPDQEFYYFDKEGNKILTTFGKYVEDRLSKKNSNSQVQTTEVVTSGDQVEDPNTGELRPIKAVTRLPNKHKKLVVLELEDGRKFKVTPDQKFFDNNSKSLVTAEEILKNPEKYDI